MKLSETGFLDEVLQHIVVQSYWRDRNNRGKPRHRLELANDTPVKTRAVALAFECACVRCGEVIHPFRSRKTSNHPDRADVKGHIFVAVTCPLEVQMGCARGREARVEYKRIVARVETEHPEHVQRHEGRPK